MKKIWTLLMGLALTSMLVLPALADQLNARIKSVDVDKNVITVIEGKKDYSLSVTGDTKFFTAKDTPLTNGIKSGDLKAGRRVTVHFANKDGKLVLADLKIRP